MKFNHVQQVKSALIWASAARGQFRAYSEKNLVIELENKVTELASPLVA